MQRDPNYVRRDPKRLRTILPRAVPAELARMRERAKDYETKGYSVGVMSDLLCVSPDVVRSLLGAP